MLEFYIDNKKVDLSSGTTVALTYQATELDKPTVTKNAFSKSIEVQGTQDNNAIFGQIWQLDRAMLNSGTTGTGCHFDARKRVNAVILDGNGNLVESGYICLDSIKKKGSDITYSITFYSALGNFFYNLSYDSAVEPEENDDSQDDYDDASERTLADLRYHFYKDDGTEMTKDEEDNDVLFNWDRDFIDESWQSLYGSNNMTDSDRKKCCDWITCAPTYSGTYDDYDNDKILVNTKGMSESTKSKYFGDITGETSADTEETSADTYTTVYGYTLVTAPRELSEWEVRGLATSQQRPAVKLSLILNAISDPENNGGYTVEWDNTIASTATTIGKYYHNSYLLLDRFDLEDVESPYPEIQSLPTGWINNVTYGGVSTTVQSGVTFDASQYSNPKIELNVLSEYNILKSAFNTIPDRIYTVYSKKSGNYMYGNTYVRLNCYQVVVMSGDTEYTDASGNTYESDVYCVFGSSNTTDVSQLKKDFSQLVAERLNVSSDRILFKNVKISEGATGIVPESRKGEFYPTGQEYITYAEDATNIQLNLPKVLMSETSKVACYLKVTPVICDRTYTDNGWGYKILSPDYTGIQYYPMVSYYENNTLKETSAFNVLTGIYSNDSNTYNGFYNGNTSPTLQKVTVDKQALFGNSKTPYEYLVGFARMFGLKFIADEQAKTIKVMRRENYYLDETIDIDDRIDRSREIIIDPCMSDYKWYKYGLETPETYATYLYSLKNNVEYGCKMFNTGYNFNSETSDLFEDTVYKNYAPYRLASIYMADKGVPNILNSKTFTVTMFKANDDGGYDTEDEVRYGYNAHQSVEKVYDQFPKICCFDKDNGNVSDLSEALCFFDGWNNITGKKFALYDNNAMMKTLNGNYCHLYTEDCELNEDNRYISKDESGNTIASMYEMLPRFEKYLTYRKPNSVIHQNGSIIASYDFVKPNNNAMSKFVGDDAVYSNDSTLMEVFWFPYSADVYSKNGKSVTAYVTLTMKPQDAMRRFYFFDNCIWVINKITDWNPESNDFCKVEFIKVQNKKYYLESADKDLVGDTSVATYTDPTPIFPDDDTKPKTVISTETTVTSGQSAYVVDAGTTQITVNCTKVTVITYDNGTIDRVTQRYSDSTEVTFDKNLTDEAVTRSGEVELLDETIEWSVVQEGKAISASGYTLNHSTQSADVVSYTTTAITVDWSVDKWVEYTDGTSATTENYDSGTETVTFDTNTGTTDVTRTGSFTKDGVEITWSVTQRPRIITYLYYTSTDENIVTPYHTTGFLDENGNSLNIVSNTYSDGQGVIGLDGVLAGIGGTVFLQCTTLKTITIPDTVTSLGYGVFADCTELESVTMPETITSMDDTVFFCCGSLTALNFPDSMTEVPVTTFEGCSGLTSFVIPSAVTSVGSNAFNQTSGLTTLVSLATTAPSYENYGSTYYAFYGMATGGTLYYPQGSDYSSWFDTTKYSLADSDWKGVETIFTTLEDGTIEGTFVTANETGRTLNDDLSIAYIGVEWTENKLIVHTDGSVEFVYNINSGTSTFEFANTSAITSSTITIEGHTVSMSNVGNTASYEFYYTTTDGKSIDSETAHTEDVFVYLYADGSVKVLDYTETYDSVNDRFVITTNLPIIRMTFTSYSFFRGKTTLKTVSLPDSLRIMGAGVFSRCTKLESVIIPSSVTEIGNSVFYGCSGLKTLTCYATTAPTIINGSTFAYTRTYGTLYYPSGSDYSTWLKELGDNLTYVGYWTGVEI